MLQTNDHTMLLHQKKSHFNSKVAHFHSKLTHFHLKYIVPDLEPPYLWPALKKLKILKFAKNG